MAMKYEKSYSSNPRPASVSVTKRVTVQPKTLQPHKLLSLSSLDRQCPTLMYLVLFYKINNNNNINNSDHHYLSLDSVFNSLKSGLEETLTIWYPATGRLSFEEDQHQPKHINTDNNRNKLNLWCNNKGALLAEAITEAKISDLGDLSQYNEFFESLVLKPSFDSNFSDMPLVVAQVTKFGCGGYSIGIGTSHSLFDGPAAYNFISDWASRSDFTKLNKSSRPHISKPVHERATLLALATSTSSSSTSNNHAQLVVSQGTIEKININNSNNFQSTGASAIDHLRRLIMQYWASQANRSNSNVTQKGFVFKTFHLSGSFIGGLKRKISEENFGFSCSSFEIVTALLWKARTKAVGLKKEALACLQFAVDTRTKLAPALPAGFSGNAFVLASVAVSAGELETLTLKATVEKIRGAKESVNNNYVGAYMAGLVHSSSQSTLPPLDELTLVTDWRRMPFHDIDFFPGVGPAFVSPLAPPTPQVACFMQSPHDSVAMDIRIGLFPTHLEAFSSYFPAKF